MGFINGLISVNRISPEPMQDSGDCHVLFVFFIRVRFRRSIAHGQSAVCRPLRRGISNTRPDRSNDRHHDHRVAHRIA